MSLRSVSLGLAVASADAANYAVIAVGSRSYSNYRHQADACHAYQVMRGKGILAENIVTMMYDDVAHDSKNPFPGKLFNKPSDGEGYDVYDGCKIDYRGDDVNAENFFAVLNGTAPGRKLESTAEDNVFVFFADHGAPGLISFPTSEVHKTELQAALRQMSSAKKFKKLVFYLETCESGSMFEDMNIPNVYAVSAANPTESSFGAYCGYDATVNGTLMNSCLGDVFAVSWMEDAEVQDLTTQSLDDQFASVLTRVTKSHPMQWGDTSFTSNHVVSDFIGSTRAQQQKPLTSAVETSSASFSQIKTPLAHLVHLYLQYHDQPKHQMHLQLGVELHRELTEQLNARAVYRHLVEMAYPSVEDQERARTATHKPDNMECEKKGLQTLRRHCAPLFKSGSGFTLQFHQQMVNVCHDIASGELNLDIEKAARAACRDVNTMGFAAMSGTIV